MNATRWNARPGFTLVELLVVIAILGILAGMTVPAVQQVRESSRRADCLNRIRQFGVAIQNYESSRRKLPPGAVLHEGTGWHAHILPFMEEENLYRTIELDDPDHNFSWMANGSPGEQACQTLVGSFRCPSDPVPTALDFNGIPDRVPCSYLAVASGTDPVDMGYPDDENVYQNFEYVPPPNPYANREPEFVQALLSGAMAPVQIGAEDGSPPPFGKRLRLRDIRDGASHTVAIGESIFDATIDSGWSVGSDHWYVGSPQMDVIIGTAQDESEFLGSTTIPFNTYHRVRDFADLSDTELWQLSMSFGSWHGGDGANFVFVDGSTRFIAATIDRQARLQLGNRADGQASDAAAY